MNNESISIFFSGDFAPCWGYETLVLARGSEIFGDLQDDISGSDLSFMNLETPFCNGGKPIDKTGPNIKAHPECVKALVDSGFNVAGLANNHIMDFGESGLVQTLETCKKSGLLPCGAGMNLAEAQKILLIEKNGIKVAFIAVAEHEFSIANNDRPGVAPLDIIDNTLMIEQARDVADLVFVTIHGGNEHFPFPRPGLRKVCRFYISCGADAVICHHAHIPGSYEFYDDKPIVYSLGNLIFDHPNPPKGWNQGYAVRIEYSMSKKEAMAFDIIPYTQKVSQGGIRRMQGQEHKAFFENITKYNNILEAEVTYIKAWDDFCKNEKNLVLLRHYLPFKFRGMRRISKILNPEFFLMPTKYNRRVKLNTIRCESHLEVLQKVLDEE